MLSKLKVIGSLLVVIWAALAVTACSDDDDNGNKASNNQTGLENVSFREEYHHRYFPISSGLTYLYESDDEVEDIDIEVEFSYNTKDIDGVNAVAVIERVYDDDDLIEESTHWYAIDVDGNVWYLAESSAEYEDDVLVEEESWEAGIDGAKAGMLMPMAPAVGDTFVIEDVAADDQESGEVISTSESVSLEELGDFNNVLLIRETDSDAESDDLYFASNLGLIKFTDDDLTFVLEDVESTISVEEEEEEEALPQASSEFGEFDDVGFEYEVNSTEMLAELILEIESEEAIVELKMWDPEGELILELEVDDIEDAALGDVVLETIDVDIETLEDSFEEGTYTFLAETVEEDELFGEAELSHDVLAATTIAACDMSFDKDATALSWSAVADVESYEVEIEAENEDIDFEMALELSSDITGFTVPAGLLEAGESYEISVAAENEDGNITVAECSFETDA